MTRRVTAWFVLAVLCLGGFAPTPSLAQEQVYDRSNHLENIRTAIQTYFAVLQRVLGLLNQIEQIEHQIRNLESLAEPEFRQIRTLLANLAQLIEQTEGLAYSLRDLDSRFRDLYPGAEPSEDLGEDYAESTRVALETARGVLLSTQRMAVDLEEAQWTLGTLREQLLAAGGNVEAMHAQGILVGFLAEEVSKGTQQLAALTNLLAVEGAHRIETEAAALATAEEWFSKAWREPRPYESHVPIPLVPASLPF